MQIVATAYPQTGAGECEYVFWSTDARINTINEAIVTKKAARFHLAIDLNRAMCASMTAAERSTRLSEDQYPYCHQIRAAESRSMVEVDGSIHLSADDTRDHPTPADNPV